MTRVGFVVGVGSGVACSGDRKIVGTGLGEKHGAGIELMANEGFDVGVGSLVLYSNGL